LLIAAFVRRPNGESGCPKWCGDSLPVINEWKVNQLSFGKIDELGNPVGRDATPELRAAGNQRPGRLVARKDEPVGVVSLWRLNPVSSDTVQVTRNRSPDLRRRRRRKS
jgi:hypothetical protein